MQGNKPVQHWVLETQGDALRLLAASGKETRLNTSRLLPWFGPQYSPGKSREEIGKLLEGHRSAREALHSSLDIMELWETAQGEVSHVSAVWLAELRWANPDADMVAAMGHAALACKTHFKFNPPEFDIYDNETVARRLEEAEAASKREELASIGGEFFRTLWGIHIRARAPLSEKELPQPHFAKVLEDMLRYRLAHPETNDDADVWKLLTKSLPEDPHLPLHLAEAWGIVPRHFNFWLDRAGYETGEDWAIPYDNEIKALAEAVASAGAATGKDAKGPFVSIDPPSTADMDDAFTIHKDTDGSFCLTLAFASPAQFWPFGSPLDKAVLRRASSLYLPEGDHHMMPRETAVQLFSLLAGKRRPATLIDFVCEADGSLRSAAPRTACIQTAANLSLPGVQAVLDGPQADPEIEKGLVDAARPFASMLREALELAELLQQRRIHAGAVITDKPEAEITLHEDEEGGELVSVCHAPHTPSAQNLVGELMILANSVVAAWAQQRNIPLFYRTQDVVLPREFAGVWTEPQDISRIVRHLPPSSIETTPRPHAGLGIAVYASLTSPIRRYTDLVNTGQILSYLFEGKPRFDKPTLDAMLPLVSAHADATAQIQRYRPRYWKLLFYKQMGDKIWWDAVVTEENDAFAQLALPLTQISVRARRKILGEKAYLGQKFKVRIGKVHPLRNELQVAAAMEA